MKKYAVLIAFGLFSLALSALAANSDTSANTTADHSKFKALQGPFKTGEEVTQACLKCHTEAAGQVMQTRHWTWDYTNPGTGQRLGKKTMLNSFCIADRSNEAFCNACHIGKTSRDTCGACHFYGGGGDGVKHGDLDSSLNKPTRDLDVHMGTDGGNFTCATCHLTEGHKIAGSRVAPTAADPHGAMRRGEKSGRNPATCQACHGDQPHKPGVGGSLLGMLTRGDRLNAHTHKLACQTCHIPAFARGGVPTKMRWDWSTAGTLDANGKPFQKKDEHGHVIFDSKKGDFKLSENVQPDYIWFDGRVDYTLKTDRIDPARIVQINRFHGEPGVADARIWPVKHFTGKQPYDLKYLTLLVPHTATPDKTALWYNYDWPKALAAGTAAAGQPFSGKFGFAETEMLWPITHMVAPKEQALGCGECHSRNGRLQEVGGVYLPGHDYTPWLDRAGFGLALLALLGVLGHGALRILTRNRREE